MISGGSDWPTGNEFIAVVGAHRVPIAVDDHNLLRGDGDGAIAVALVVVVSFDLGTATAMAMPLVLDVIGRSGRRQRGAQDGHDSD